MMVSAVDPLTGDGSSRRMAFRNAPNSRASTVATRTVIHMPGAPLAREPSDTGVKSKVTTLGG